MNADNFHIDISSEGKEDFIKVMSLCIKHKVEGYSIKGNSLVLYWSNSSKDCIPFPYKMSCEAVSEFVYGWLQEVEYKEEPDQDGDNHKGWKVYNESWSRVGDDPYTIVAIEPRWMIYGK